MANMYANPAQAQFVNTYVPIPFDALMGLSENAKLERQANEQRLQDIRTKFGSFTSRSQADMARWNQEVTQPLQQVANQIASNPDAIKGEEGRMLLAGVTNNMNYGLLDKLRQNAINLEESYKSYDPRWQDDTLSNITNWDTASRGLYERQNIPFQTIENLGEPYFKNLKPGFVPELSNAARSVYGITQKDLERVSQTAFNSLYADPTFQKHMNRLGINTNTPEGQEAARRIILQSRADKPYISKVDENQSYLESLKQRNRMALESVKQRNRKSNLNTALNLGLDRVESNKETIAENALKQRQFTQGSKNVDTFTRTREINTGNPQMDNMLNNQVKRFDELSVKSMTSPLTPNETKELQNLNFRHRAIATTLDNIGEIDNIINSYDKLRLTGKESVDNITKQNLDHLQKTRNRILQSALKLDPALNPGLTEQQINANIEDFNRWNGVFNKQMKFAQQGINESNISQENKDKFADILSGFRPNSGQVTSEINDYTKHLFGVDPLHEATYNKKEGSVKQTNKVVGYPINTAGTISLLDLRPNSKNIYVDTSERSFIGELSNLLYENPTSLTRSIDINDESSVAKFGGTSVPALTSSNEGKVKLIPTRDNQGQIDYKYQSSQNVKVPSDKILELMINHNITKSDKLKVNEITSALVEQLGYKPNIEKINGVDYIVLKGAMPYLDNPNANTAFSRNWGSDKGVKARGKENYELYSGQGNPIVDAIRSSFYESEPVESE